MGAVLNFLLAHLFIPPPIQLNLASSRLRSLNENKLISPKGLRRSCEDIARRFSVIEVEMVEKVSSRQMESVVHKRFEKVVEYLKDSMSATAQDELKFELKIAEFQTAVQVCLHYFSHYIDSICFIITVGDYHSSFPLLIKSCHVMSYLIIDHSFFPLHAMSCKKLSNTKADRTEYGQLQEQVLRIQAGVHKLHTQMKEKEILAASEASCMTKAEVNYLLDRKVSKTEFQLQIESLLRSLKKNRKLAALSAG